MSKREGESRGRTNGQRRREVNIAECQLAMCDDDVIKLALFVCMCACAHVLYPLGVLGFVIQPSIPVHWLNDINFRHPNLASYRHHQPPSVSLSVPISNLSPPVPSVSHPHHLVLSLTSEGIAGSLGNPCLELCYLDHLITALLEPSQSRYMRRVCVVSHSRHSFVLTRKHPSSGNLNRGCAGYLEAKGGWLCVRGRASKKDKSKRWNLWEDGFQHLIGNY